ncbi:MAG: alpha/beta fold hydrolase [Bradyrhizobium sp.]|uniref:alpha/beta hydrolase n=1 Tax=Bradyrhizobium sp. TaxID=376 RepID=UPI0025BFEF0B|nr:alpha/beta fold hydrolase [Bradyrhizobium sp.]MBI5261770.1 alpha/beta fold hydrolase [Bradyrhizobium sp.]
MRCLIGLTVLLLSLLPVGAAEQERELSIGAHAVLATLRTPVSMGPDTPLIVITHGTLAHKDMETIQGLAKALAERGIGSLSHTLSLGLDRRKGMYDCAVRHDHLADDAIAEIEAWVAAAKSLSPRVYVLGHSRGANQVARYLKARPDAPVRAAMMLAPATASVEAALRASYLSTYGAPLDPLLKEAIANIAAGRGGEWMSVPGFIYCRNSVVTARAFASFYTTDARQDTAGLVAGLKLPVLVLAAAKDTTVPDVAASFAPLARSEKVRLETIEGADHFFLDLAADDVADRIAEFIKQVP